MTSARTSVVPASSVRPAIAVLSAFIVPSPLCVTGAGHVPQLYSSRVSLGRSSPIRSGTTRRNGAPTRRRTEVRRLGDVEYRNQVIQRIERRRLFQERLDHQVAAGAERTTNSVATFPDAPGLLSTTTGCASFRARPSAHRRARRSVSPPGALQHSALRRPLDLLRLD